MADRYLVPGGTGDYNSTTNWSTTSGGASGASKPVAADRLIIDANSLNTPLTVNTPNDCLSFTASNYTGVVTINSTLQTNGITNTGNITLSAGMTITGIGTFAKKGTSVGVITSNGVVFDCNFSFTNTVASITTITGTMQVNGDLSSTLNSTVTTTVNTGTIKVGGNIIHNNPLVGTSTIELIGTNPATIIQVATRYLQTNLIINKGTGTFNQVDLYYGVSSRTLTYTSGIVNHTGILFTNNTGTTTLNTNGMTWNTIAPQGSIGFTSVCNANKIGRSSANTAMSFGGTHGFNINEFEFIFTSASITTNIVFVGNVEYKINTSIICTSEAGVGVTFRCNTGIAIINLKENAFMKMVGINILNINASNKTLRILKNNTITTSTNCFKIDSNINPYSTTR